MNWFEIIYLIWIAICWVWIVLSLGAISNCNRRSKLLDAIFIYRLTCLGNNDFKKLYSIEFDDINRFYGIWDYLPWNWRYKRLLPADKYEIIKPYLKKVKGRKNA